MIISYNRRKSMATDAGYSSLSKQTAQASICHADARKHLGISDYPIAISIILGGRQGFRRPKKGGSGCSFEGSRSERLRTRFGEQVRECVL